MRSKTTDSVILGTILGLVGGRLIANMWFGHMVHVGITMPHIIFIVAFSILGGLLTYFLLSLIETRKNKENDNDN